LSFLEETTSANASMSGGFCGFAVKSIRLNAFVGLNLIMSYSL